MTKKKKTNKERPPSLAVCLLLFYLGMLVGSAFNWHDVISTQLIPSNDLGGFYANNNNVIDGSKVERGPCPTSWCSPSPPGGPTPVCSKTYYGNIVLRYHCKEYDTNAPERKVCGDGSGMYEYLKPETKFINGPNFYFCVPKGQPRKRGTWEGPNVIKVDNSRPGRFERKKEGGS